MMIRLSTEEDNEKERGNDSVQRSPLTWLTAR